MPRQYSFFSILLGLTGAATEPDSVSPDELEHAVSYARPREAGFRT